MSIITQLGLGGALVGFAVWLQDKFAQSNRTDLAEVREEMRRLQEKHDADIEAERARHEETRTQLIAALMKSYPPESESR